MDYETYERCSMFIRKIYVDYIVVKTDNKQHPWPLKYECFTWLSAYTIMYDIVQPV